MDYALFNQFARVMGLASATLLAACAPLKPIIIETGLSSEQARLATPQQAVTAVKAPILQPTKNQTAQTLSSWTITGAIAAKKKNKAWSASLFWQQQSAQAYLIRLFGPMGGGTVLIEKKGNLITYRDGQKTSTSTDADTLLAQETGFHLPIQNLYYWVRALPAPGVAHEEIRSVDGHLNTLKQAGYTLHYTTYTHVGKLELPTKIHVDGPEGTVKLVIKQWKIPG